MLEMLAVRADAVFTTCCVALVLQMLAVAFATPLVRMKRNVWANDEDAADFAGTVDRSEHPDVARLLRTHRNQLENFVPFSAIGGMWIASHASPALGATLFVAFTLARTGHLAAYLAGRRRPRTACHTLSFLVLLALTLGLAWRAAAG